MTTTDNSDDTLVARILAGDKEQFRVVVNEHLPTIYALIMRQVGDTALAEELSQETFAKAYVQLKSFRGEARLGTWLVRIALNQTNSYFSSRRHKERLCTQPLNLERHDQPADSGRLGDLQQYEQAAARLRAAVGRLSAKLRDVVALVSFEGKSYEEAAALLGIPVGTVRSRLNHARLQLRILLEEEY